MDGKHWLRLVDMDSRAAYLYRGSFSTNPGHFSYQIRYRQSLNALYDHEFTDQLLTKAEILESLNDRAKDLLKDPSYDLR